MPETSAITTATPLLAIEGLVTSFATESGRIRAVDGIDLKVHAGKTLGLVGESGCGKSVTALSIMRLIPTPSGSIDAGTISFNGANLVTVWQP